ncbi:MAG: alpha/beta fold hydrolase [Pseudomonadota bacterium]
MLNTIEYGQGGTPLVIAHGLFGSARNWGVIAKRMARDRRVICVDMRNHAGSFWSPDMSYGAMADDLAEVIAPLGRADLLGHSMGGKAAMVAALKGAPLRRIVIADIAPVPYTHTQTPMIDAMERLDLSEIDTRSQADEALAAEIDAPGIRAFLLQSLDVKARAWRLNLAALRDQMPEIIGFPRLSAAHHGPALFLSGSASDYVTPKARPAIKALFPGAQFAKIPGAGHWLHAEKPREFEAALSVFLSGG